MSNVCLPDKRGDGLSQRQVQERRLWMHTAVGAEAMGRGENWERVYDSYTSTGTRGWVDLVQWWADAANILAAAVHRFDSPDVDMVLTVEHFVSKVYIYFNQYGSLPGRHQQLVLAAEAVTD